MHYIRLHITPLLSAVFLGALAATLLIYLTPLKWITMIEPTVKDIAPQEFFTQFQKNPNAFLFVDVRTPEEYRHVHAKGSVNIPLVDLYDTKQLLPRHGKEIVLICTVGRSSGVAYSYLQHYGFFNIERVAGGLKRWTAENLPVEGDDIPVNQQNAVTQGGDTTDVAVLIQKYACPIDVVKL